MFYSRIEREKATIAAMIRIYCRDRHRAKIGICRDCSALEDYATLRIEKCPLKDFKTTCAQCPVHCYKEEMRDKIKSVMRYSGPRMLRRHPVLAILHLIDSLKGRKLRDSL